MKNLLYLTFVILFLISIKTLVVVGEEPILIEDEATIHDLFFQKEITYNEYINLLRLFKCPLELNSGNLYRLKGIPGIDINDIKNIIKFRRQKDKIETFEQLKTILNPYKLQILKPFIQIIPFSKRDFKFTSKIYIKYNHQLNEIFNNNILQYKDLWVVTFQTKMESQISQLSKVTFELKSPTSIGIKFGDLETTFGEGLIMNESLKGFLFKLYLSRLNIEYLSGYSKEDPTKAICLNYHYTNLYEIGLIAKNRLRTNLSFHLNLDLPRGRLYSEFTLIKKPKDILFGIETKTSKFGLNFFYEKKLVSPLISDLMKKRKKRRKIFLRLKYNLYKNLSISGYIKRQLIPQNQRSFEVFGRVNIRNETLRISFDKKISHYHVSRDYIRLKDSILLKLKLNKRLRTYAHLNLYRSIASRLCLQKSISVRFNFVYFPNNSLCLSAKFLKNYKINAQKILLKKGRIIFTIKKKVKRGLNVAFKYELFCDEDSLIQPATKIFIVLNQERKRQKSEQDDKKISF